MYLLPDPAESLTVVDGTYTVISTYAKIFKCAMLSTSPGPRPRSYLREAYSGPGADDPGVANGESILSAYATLST